MTLARATTLWASLLGLSVGLTVWLWFWTLPVERGAPSVKDAVRTPIRQPDAPHPEGPPRDRVPATALEVRVAREDGMPVVGSVWWSCSPEAPRTSSALAPDAGCLLPVGAEHVAHRGEARLMPPPGHWTWLRVTAEGGPLLSAYRLVPPLSGIRREEIRLAHEQRGLHLFVLERDLATPVPRQPVSVYRREMNGAGTLALACSPHTDEHGYTYVKDLSPGMYFACAPGCAPTERPPQVLPVMLMPQTPLTEVACTLVMPEPRHPVRLRIWSDVTRANAFMTRLFLRGALDREGELYPLPEPLRPGYQELTMSVPRGDYALDALPLGELDIVPSGPLRLGWDEALALEVRVHERNVETKVELVGPEPTDFPLRLRPVHHAELQPADATPLFLGPHLWHGPIQPVFARVEGAHFAASGRGSHWLSTAPVTLAGGSCRVAMQRAARVVVQWTPPWSARPARVLVDAVAASFFAALELRQELIPDRGVMRPALTGAIVVPQGSVEIRAWDSGTGAALWTRDVQADRHEVQVVVEDG